MAPELHEKLRHEITALRALLAQRTTESISGWYVAAIQVDTQQCVQKYGLVSPYRQLSFLLGLMSSTPEPHRSAAISDTEWRGICNRLNAVYMAYPAIIENTFVSLEYTKKRSLRGPYEIATLRF